MVKKKVILIFCDYYIPGFKAGGPINSLQSICNSLCHDYDIYLITRDRDIGEKEKYKNIPVNTWLPVGGIRVMYKKANNVSLLFVRSIIKDIRPDVLHLNSLMSRRFSLIPMLTTIFLYNYPLKILLSPRGELSGGALALKKKRKQIYLKCFTFLGFEEKVKWIASSEGERSDILKKFKKSNLIIHRVDNTPNSKQWITEQSRSQPKNQNEIKLVFYSRISPMKNLKFLLNQLKTVKFRVHLFIYGPHEDKEYLDDCLNIAKKIPSQISIEILRELDHQKVYSILKDFDLFVLPTLGENFGQAIWESLASSVPILISDRTPWRNLEEKGVGWDVNLDNPDRFNAAIKMIYKMNEQQHSLMRSRCRTFALNYISDSESMKLLKGLYNT